MILHFFFLLHAWVKYQQSLHKINIFEVPIVIISDVVLSLKFIDYIYHALYTANSAGKGNKVFCCEIVSAYVTVKVFQ